jgi:MFS family permease
MSDKFKNSASLNLKQEPGDKDINTQINEVFKMPRFVNYRKQSNYPLDQTPPLEEEILRFPQTDAIHLKNLVESNENIVDRKPSDSKDTPDGPQFHASQDVIREHQNFNINGVKMEDLVEFFLSRQEESYYKS